jgi:ArsR family transcriptional regulator
MCDMAADLVALENLFLGLADKTRLRLLSLMADGPVSVGHLVAETGESQPKISRHLAYLRNAGLVDTTRDGKWIYYGVAEIADPSAGPVFHCVVDELSGRSSQQKRPRRSQPRGSQSRSNIPTSDNVDPSMPYIPHDEYADEAATEMDWTQPTEERSDELEIFLL